MTKDAFDKHIRRHRIYSCLGCSKAMLNFTELKEHATACKTSWPNIITSKIEFTCLGCQKSFDKHVDLLQHYFSCSVAIDKDIEETCESEENIQADIKKNYCKLKLRVGYPDSTFKIKMDVASVNRSAEEQKHRKQQSAKPQVLQAPPLALATTPTPRVLATHSHPTIPATALAPRPAPVVVNPPCPPTVGPVIQSVGRLLPCNSARPRPTILRLARPIGRVPQAVVQGAIVNGVMTKKRELQPNPVSTVPFNPKRLKVVSKLVDNNLKKGEFFIRPLGPTHPSAKFPVVKEITVIPGNRPAPLAVNPGTAPAEQVMPKIVSVQSPSLQIVQPYESAIANACKAPIVAPGGVQSLSPHPVGHMIQKQLPVLPGPVKPPNPPSATIVVTPPTVNPVKALDNSIKSCEQVNDPAGSRIIIRQEVIASQPKNISTKPAEQQSEKKTVQMPIPDTKPGPVSKGPTESKVQKVIIPFQGLLKSIKPVKVAKVSPVSASSDPKPVPPNDPEKSLLKPNKAPSVGVSTPNQHTLLISKHPVKEAFIKMSDLILPGETHAKIRGHEKTSSPDDSGPKTKDEPKGTSSPAKCDGKVAIKQEVPSAHIAVKEPDEGMEPKTETKTDPLLEKFAKLIESNPKEFEHYIKSNDVTRTGLSLSKIMNLRNESDIEVNKEALDLMDSGIKEEAFDTDSNSCDQLIDVQLTIKSEPGQSQVHLLKECSVMVENMKMNPETLAKGFTKITSVRIPPSKVCLQPDLVLPDGCSDWSVLDRQGSPDKPEKKPVILKLNIIKGQGELHDNPIHGWDGDNVVPVREQT